LLFLIPIHAHLRLLITALTTLLALAWSSYRGWGASSYEQVSVLVEMEVIFTVFGSVGLLRHLLKAWYPWYVWFLLAVLLVFAIAWAYHLWKKE